VCRHFSDTCTLERLHPPANSCFTISRTVAYEAALQPCSCTAAPSMKYHTHAYQNGSQSCQVPSMGKHAQMMLSATLLTNTEAIGTAATCEVCRLLSKLAFWRQSLWLEALRGLSTPSSTHSSSADATEQDLLGTSPKSGTCNAPSAPSLNNLRHAASPHKPHHSDAPTP
jgi:hypothetical protein